MKFLSVFLMVLLVLAAAPAQSAENPANPKPEGPPAAGPVTHLVGVFLAGAEGYHTYRIPSLIVTPKGTVLAFCEGRKAGRGDSGNIDLVLKRSTDGGNTWQPMQIVWDDGPNTIGNPCPVVDRSTGTIWLPLTRNRGEDNEAQIKNRTSKESRTVWMTKSTDDGVTWAKPVEITATTKSPDWTWYATGPGCGIQLRSGRMVIPCDHALAGSGLYRSHVIYSDDHGETWKLGGVIGDKVNECQVVELGDGSLLMNMRNYRGTKCRAVSTSRDGGLTWTPAQDDPALVEPVCQAALIRIADPQNAGRGILVFSNPASTKREKMTVRLSLDEGKTWPISGLLSSGPAAYSALAMLPDGRIGCLFEYGEKSPYEKISLAIFSLQWLTSPHQAVEPAR
ncbi:MAG: exo-alpha-sialidase [Planctomycetes bacterium]|nr:exo-alpha-sialidase [Planctomycetota bacterium]